MTRESDISMEVMNLIYKFYILSPDKAMVSYCLSPEDENTNMKKNLPSSPIRYCNISRWILRTRPIVEKD